MRYRMNIETDSVSHLIGYCLRNKTEAEKIYRTVVTEKGHKVELITGSVHLSPEERAEFAARFSAEVEPAIWTSSFRKH